MNDFNWRNQPRTTTSPASRHVVEQPLPISFNGCILPGTKVKPENRNVFPPKTKAKL